MSLYYEIKNLVEKHFCVPDKNVFHNTKSEGYENIIRTKFLRLNSHIYLNKSDPDNRELKIAYKLIIENLIDSKISSERIIFEEYIKRGVVFYTASFSLNQSIYAFNKYGEYCIELESNKLNQLQNSTNSSEISMFASVLYDEAQQEKIINEIFEVFNKHFEPNKGREQIIDLFNLLTVIMPLFKHADQSLDNECRIVQAEIFDPVTGKLEGKPKIKLLNIENSIANIYRKISEEH